MSVALNSSYEDGREGAAIVERQPDWAAAYLLKYRPSHPKSGDGYKSPELPIGNSAKRWLDIWIAGTLLIVSIPLLLMVAFLIKITMGSPVFFIQSRVGFGGKVFRCLKFRTMVAGSAETLQALLAENPNAYREWFDTRKLRRDPRITPFGHLLRRTSLDELPQLVNILRGEMSCVGPRPVVEAELERYGPYTADYIRARPGLTGLWQVSGRNNISYSERIALDRYYVRRWSPALDILILLRTIPALLRQDETA